MLGGAGEPSEEPESPLYRAGVATPNPPQGLLAPPLVCLFASELPGTGCQKALMDIKNYKTMQDLINTDFEHAHTT